MNILIGTSLITAFIAGIAALLAPCCITVLLPSYLASIFKHKRTVFLMTTFFFLGVLTVFLPLGLGIAAVGQFLKNYHNQLYTIGGSFLILLGASILLGKHFSLPFGMHKKQANQKIEGAWSVFVLGIFSGFATLCCAPVLAGVIALSALPGSTFWGGIYSLAYSLGMVAPLFLIAYFLDKSNLAGKLQSYNKPIRYSLFGQEVAVALSEFIAGAVYFLMGILIIYLDWTNQLAMGGNGYGATINIYTARFTGFLTGFMDYVPAWIWIVFVIAALYLIFRIGAGTPAQSKVEELKKDECCENKNHE